MNLRPLRPEGRNGRSRGLQGRGIRAPLSVPVGRRRVGSLACSHPDSHPGAAGDTRRHRRYSGAQEADGGPGQWWPQAIAPATPKAPLTRAGVGRMLGCRCGAGRKVMQVLDQGDASGVDDVGATIAGQVVRAVPGTPRAALRRAAGRPDGWGARSERQRAERGAPPGRTPTRGGAARWSQ